MSDETKDIQIAERAAAPKAYYWPDGHLKWGFPIDVGHLILQLQTLDPKMKVSSVSHIQMDGGTRARAFGLSMSRERWDAAGWLDCKLDVPECLAIWATLKEPVPQPGAELEKPSLEYFVKPASAAEELQTPEARKWWLAEIARRRWENIVFHTVELFGGANYELIAPKLLERLGAYRDDGIPVGSFLEAVISNNLRNAIGNADEYNRATLFHLIAWMHNNFPSPLWGSAEKYSAWINTNRQLRERAAEAAGEQL